MESGLRVLGGLRKFMGSALNSLGSAFLRQGEALLFAAHRRGSVQFGAAPLDTLLAPGISNFNEAEIPDLTGMFPEADHWLANFFLNCLIGPRYTDQWKQAAITFMFRTQNAIGSYGTARATTLECVGGWSPGRPDFRRYFQAVSQWETVIINMQVTLNLYTVFIDPNAVETGDAARLRQIGNRIKHFAEDIRDQPANQADLTLPMWLGASGLLVRTANLSFAEIAENIREMAAAADIPQILKPHDQTAPLARRIDSR